MHSQGLFHAGEGIELHYLDWGGTGTPIVLLAGSGGTAQIFQSLGPRLASNYRVLALTRRGHGRSSIPESGYDLETLASDRQHYPGERMSGRNSRRTLRKVAVPTSIA